jgi:hypothetical protein
MLPSGALNAAMVIVLSARLIDLMRWWNVIKGALLGSLVGFAVQFGAGDYQLGDFTSPDQLNYVNYIVF